MSERPTANKRKHRWTWDLLSSSLPLEFAVARRVATFGFQVIADYPYEREIAGVVKEYSIDIKATKSIPKTLPDAGFSEKISTLTALIECKYRRPSKAVLLLPEIAGSKATAERETIRGLVAMSTVINVDPWTDLSLPVCYKAVEVDFDTNDRGKSVIEGELQHGFEQLQYALINDVIEYIRSASALLQFGIGEPAEFALPILVTNAPVYIANNDFDVIDLSSVTNIDEIATPVQAAVCELSVGPRLRAEVARLMATGFDETEERFKALDVSKGKATRKRSAALEFKLLQSRVDLLMVRYFSRVVLCKEEYLDKLIEQFENIVKNCLSKATEVEHK